MLEDIIKSAREYFVDRAANPLTGAFAVSWCLWNYKFLLVIISNEPVVRKFHLIRSIIFTGMDQAVIHGILLPLCTALAYLFLYPKPARFVYEHALRQKRMTLEARRKAEGEDVLSVGDSIRLRERYTKIQLDHRAEIADLTVTIEGQADQIAMLAQKAEQAASELAKATAGNRRGEPLTEEELKSRFALEHSIVIAEARIEELQKELESARRSSEGLVIGNSNHQVVTEVATDSDWPPNDPHMYSALRNTLEFMADEQYPTYPHEIQTSLSISHGYAKYLLQTLVNLGFAAETYTEDVRDTPGYQISRQGIEALLVEGWDGSVR